MKQTQKIRLGLLFFIILFLSWLGYRHQIMGGGPAGSPTVDALCPFGGLEGLRSFITDGSWLRRLAPSSLILFGGTILATLFAGRIFCGWLCPLGGLYEFANMGARKMGIKQFHVPAPVDRFLRFFKYIVLLAATALTWKTGVLVIRDYDPWAAFMHLSALSTEAGIGLGVLIVTLILGLFIERFWCRYLCPLGAALALLSPFSFVKIRRNEESCIPCRDCDETCPVEISPEAVTIVKDRECLACGKCADACPVEKTLFFGTAQKQYKTLAIALIGIALFVSVIPVAKGFGVWKTFAVPNLSSSSTNPADKIYGWMTITQVAETINLSTEETLKAAQLPEDTSLSTPIKKMDGVDDEKVRELLAEYLRGKKKKKE